jgi:hypothetical protein
MKRNYLTHKVLVSCLLTVTILTGYSLTSYGAPEANKKTTKSTLATANETAKLHSTAVPGVPEGVLTLSEAGALIANGSVSVNGIAAKSGTTVVSGSTIVVGGDGLAMLDLTPFGRVTLGPNTTAKITYSGGDLLVQAVCNDMRVAVKEGQVNVAIPNRTAKVLSAGQDEHFDSAVEVSAKGFVDVILNCGTDVVCPPLIQVVEPTYFPLFAFFLLGGAATTASVGVVLGGPTKASIPPVSGFRP